MVKMDIENVLNKYFEGETTLEEERKLCIFQSGKLAAEHLKELAPIFNYQKMNKLPWKH